MRTTKKMNAYTLAFIGAMAAIIYVVTLFRFPLLGSKVHFANAMCLLGGMSAEEVFLGSFSAGNSSDLDKATSLACRYVATYGMSDAGLIQFANARFNMGELANLPSETLAAMTRVLDECHDEAKRLVEECRGAIEAIASALKEKSTLTGEELLKIWEGSKPGADTTVAATD